MRRFVKYFAIIWLTGCCSIVSAQFTNVTEQIGEIYTVPTSLFGVGVSFYDYNEDGWDDLSLSRGEDPPLFFTNDSGTFVPADFIIPTSSTRLIMLLWADYDNDGDQDLLITKKDGSVELWNNDGAFNFSNVASQAGIANGSYYHSGAAFADYDHDGCLDLYIGKVYQQAFEQDPEYFNILYRSNCDGTFSNVTAQAGVEILPSLTFQPAFFDYNKDGWEDLYLINDLPQHINNLFRNNGDGTFTDVSEETGAGIYIDAMTATVGDFDNDLDLDFFVSNRTPTGGNHLMVNDGNGNFSNQASEMGFYTDHTSWGCSWLDYDNDGWQDIFVSIAFSQLHEGSLFHVNSTGDNFIEMREELGFGEDYSRTYTCAKGDMNNDGYFDLVHSSNFLTPSQLYQNQGGSNNFLSVSLEGTLSNRDGIGVWLNCYAEDMAYVRYTMRGEDLLGQSSDKEIFGLGNATLVDSLIVEWNSGTREVYTDVNINQHLHLIEGASFSNPFELEYNGDLFLCPNETVELYAGQYQEYLWSTGDTTQVITVSEPGTYQLTVIDTFGLTIESFPIQVEVAPVVEVIEETSDISCTGAADGSITINLSDALIDSIEWNNGDSLAQITGLMSGVYSYEGLDEYGCPFFGKIAINEPSPLIGQAEPTDALCFGEASGSVLLEVLGGTAPYNPIWEGLNPEALMSGDYSVLVLDSNNCSVDIAFSIDSPDSLFIEVFIQDASSGNNNGTANINISGGTPPYYVSWSNGNVDTLWVAGLATGEYSVNVSDENGCEKSISFSIGTNTSSGTMESAGLSIFPNPVEDLLNIVCSKSNIGIIELYNTTGQRVLYQNQSTSRTSLRVSNLPSGIYYLRFPSLTHSPQTKITIK